jgi:valyl-tRNA synthetase
MSKEKTDTQKVVEEVLDTLPVVVGVNELYRQFLGMTNIERVHEEDFVLREILRGRSKNEIIEKLKAKHPEEKFNYEDLERFMARNNEVVKAMGKEVSLTARRHLEAKAHCSEMLAGVALYTQKLIQDFRSEGDNTNTVAAIRALNQTLENYMKLEGMVGNSNEGGKVINVIQNISDKKARLKDRIHNANFVDINPESSDDNGQVQ